MAGVLGASVSMAGLLLVFSGFLFAQAAGLPPATPDDVIDRFRRGARVGVAPFLLSLAVAGLSFGWLLSPWDYIYWTTIASFILLLVGTALYGAITILYYL